MLTKSELVERMIESSVIGLPKDCYDRLFAFMMNLSDFRLIEDLRSKGLYYEKIGSYFICKS